MYDTNVWIKVVGQWRCLAFCPMEMLASSYATFVNERPKIFMAKNRCCFKGAAGVEPATSRSAVECSATELYPLGRSGEQKNRLVIRQRP